MITSSRAVDESDTVLAHEIAGCVEARLAALEVDVVPVTTGKVEIKTAIKTTLEMVARLMRKIRFIETNPFRSNP